MPLQTTRHFAQTSARPAKKRVAPWNMTPERMTILNQQMTHLAVTPTLPADAETFTKLRSRFR